MRKSIKIFIAIFILAIVLLTPVVYAEGNIPDATSDFYVNDFASVFSSSEKTRLMDKAIALSEEHNGIQVVVTTVKSLNGSPIEDYAYEMYNQYGIGKDDMGLLILLATEDREIRVEVGKSMEAYINDSKAGRFIDKYAIPYLRDNKFNEGLINLQEALIDEVISSVKNDTLDTNATSNAESKAHAANAAGICLIILAIICLIALIVFLFYKIKTKRRERKEQIDNLNAKVKQLEEEIVKKEQIARKDAQSLNKKIRNLIDKNNQVGNNYQKLQNDYDILKDRYERATKLYPTVDSEITSMIEDEKREHDMAMAESFDLEAERVISLPASKDIVSRLNNVIWIYSTLTAEQKTYVKSDITKVRQLYDESVSLKEEYDRKVREDENKKCAKKAAIAITAIISAISIGRASHLSRLKEAKSIYDGLDSGARRYFDKSILDKLDSLYEEAKRDKEEEEARRRREEEERRRRNSYYSHTSSSSRIGSSSHFGGFGGRSGGGGASRRF